MKTCSRNHKKCLLAVVLGASAVLFLAATKDPQPVAKLEGAWVAHVQETGVIGLVTDSPNPSGKSSTFQNQMLLPKAFMEFMKTQIPGFTGFSMEIGEEVMTGKTTGTYIGRWYGLVDGAPALVYLDDAMFEFVSPTEIHITHTVNMYAADEKGQPTGPKLDGGTYHTISTRITK